ncbi:DNA ligase D [Leeuwenhoekiella polynyae]|uniref:DNA ligase (ATP) n=1 Tax=Leeuwenhoekiella polynyae TaxID=1550906 RepID=A0A4Q0PGN3_9FLAO|nr:DNA ligase D [Leeuwenhoekiella polynyae]RXG26055.1 bifunctional non-homologous end joining protein LigD [Leeuwenhoekiella polynyae]
MGLEEYKRKRDFNKTPEPAADIHSKSAGRFVIQRHQASRLHYDLRLELDGVLKSWAVPKGPSLNPADKRLAVQTEDHPIRYLTFHGTIPKGNYGAGEMIIWDEGTFTIAAGYPTDALLQHYEKGDLKIQFFGTKIKGTFALVHTKRENADNHWLLIKKKDSYATDLHYDAEVFVNRNQSPASSSTPIKKLDPSQFIRPMLATATKNIFNDPEWVYELKWDGYRVLAHIQDGKVNLHSRNGINYTEKFEKLKQDLEAIEHDAILDGEVVVVDADGLPQFQALQNYTHTTAGTLRYYVFDMLNLNGHDMLDLPLLDRKSLIPEVIAGCEATLYCDHIEGMGSALYNKAVDAGMEGVIAKHKESTYAPGYRSEKWLKIKAVLTEETLICGYTNSNSGGTPFGSLILGMYTEDKLKYVGNCGSGFSNEEQHGLLKQLKKLSVAENPFGKKINLKGRKPNWIIPQLICEVKFSEWTTNHVMRHPVYKGLRSDKIPQEIRIQKPHSVSKKTQPTSEAGIEVAGHYVNFTNLEKIYWPASGYTKYDLIDYYIQVSEYMLPYLKDRPQSLHRHPDGINKKGFYHKDQEHLPAWMETVSVFSKSLDRKINYLLCQNEAALLYMANLGCIEINPWNSRVGTLEKPDYAIIDLDPSDTNTFEEVITVAQAVKEILDRAGIKGFCKTSGSSGLHIYLPLAAQYSYAEARNFTKLLCMYVEEQVPNLTSMTRAVKDRKGKIYLDYLQNRKGQTLASPYCVRPKPGATVSAPLEWKEVNKGLKINQFTLKTMVDRLQEQGDLFAGILGAGIDMAVALEKLENE